MFELKFGLVPLHIVYFEQVLRFHILTQELPKYNCRRRDGLGELLSCGNASWPESTETISFKQILFVRGSRSLRNVSLLD
jgi:hypothetical protein